MRQFCGEALKYRTFCCKNVVYGLWAKKNEKIVRRAEPAVYRALHHIKLAHILRPFQVTGQLLEKHSWTEKKEEHSWTALEANCFTWTRRQPRKRALFGVICPTWRRILGKAEESSWVMFKAHLRDLARSWGEINFAWAGWHDELFNMFAFLWNSTLGSKPLFVRGHVGFWHGSYSWDLYWQQHVGAAFVHLSDWVGLGLCWSVDGK